MDKIECVLVVVEDHSRFAEVMCGGQILGAIATAAGSGITKRRCG